MSTAAVVEVLKTHCNLRCDVVASALTTFKIGGPIPVVMEIASESELHAIHTILREHSVAARTIGAGSNIVAPSDGLPDFVIKLAGAFDHFSVTGSTVVAGGAALLPALSLKTSQAGLSGFEFAAGIPGTIGGGLRMNCGAHGGSIGSRVLSVRIYLPSSGTFSELVQDECHFGYRSNSIPAEAIITEATFKLVESTKETTLAERAKCLAYRKATQPLALPSAGSVFRNPSDTVSAGSLIEEVGLKGTKVGGAEISTLHANWIVNPDRNAHSDDVRSLVDLCQAQVALKKGIILHPEILFW